MDTSRIESKLESIDKAIQGVSTLQAVHTQQLADHMRRTDLLETTVNGLPQKALIFISIVSGFIALIKLAL